MSRLQKIDNSTTSSLIPSNTLPVIVVTVVDFVLFAVTTYDCVAATALADAKDWC